MINHVKYFKNLDGVKAHMKGHDFYVQNSKDYKNHLIVEKLPPKVPLGGGEIATIEEVRDKKLNLIIFNRSHLLKITMMELED